MSGWNSLYLVRTTGVRFNWPMEISFLSAEFANASSRALSKSTSSLAAFNNSHQRSISAVTRVVLGVAIVCERLQQSCRLVGRRRPRRCDASTSRQRPLATFFMADLPPTHNTPFVPAWFSQRPGTTGRWRIGKRRISVNPASYGLIADFQLQSCHLAASLATRVFCRNPCRRPRFDTMGKRAPEPIL
jgi:hypothetical protein